MDEEDEIIFYISVVKTKFIYGEMHHDGLTQKVEEILAVV
jgi:hypothetical protein